MGDGAGMLWALFAESPRITAKYVDTIHPEGIIKNKPVKIRSINIQTDQKDTKRKGAKR
jgi:hypothetical protein